MVIYLFCLNNIQNQKKSTMMIALNDHEKISLKEKYYIVSSSHLNS